MQASLTKGPVTRSLLRFAAPMIAGNLLQQVYNIADTLIVGRFLGADALAAVGASYAVMVFLTSVVLGLCMGSGMLFSMQYGAGDTAAMKHSMVLSFGFIGITALLIEGLSLALIDPFLRLLQIPAEVWTLTRSYLFIIFIGTFFVFVYNYFAAVLRAAGNSAAPLIFLAVSAVLNIGLDLLFVVVIPLGVGGAALATILAQAVSGAGIAVYVFVKIPALRPRRADFRFDKAVLGRIVQYSLLTCVQQSVMNLGILLVQGLVNSFGVTVMAAFAAAVKIDSFAYMPVQDFGNAFSFFIAQNKGAGESARIRRGLRSAVVTALVFCAGISAAVAGFARPLMGLFVRPEETEILRIGVEYLRIEGSCYFGIGILFLLYGLYRGIGRPGFSVVLTVISLGTRVALAYLLAPIEAVGLPGIWWAVPIGWFLADATGLIYYACLQRRAKRQP